MMLNEVYMHCNYYAEIEREKQEKLEKEKQEKLLKEKLEQEEKLSKTKAG